MVAKLKIRIISYNEFKYDVEHCEKPLSKFMLTSSREHSLLQCNTTAVSQYLIFVKTASEREGGGGGRGILVAVSSDGEFAV